MCFEDLQSVVIQSFSTQRNQKSDLNYFSVWNSDINLERNLIPSKLITEVQLGWCLAEEAAPCVKLPQWCWGTIKYFRKEVLEVIKLSEVQLRWTRRGVKTCLKYYRQVFLKTLFSSELCWALLYLFLLHCIVTTLNPS